MHPDDRYRRAAAAGGVGVWDWNFATGEIYVDPVLRELLGYKDDEIRNDPDDWARVLHPDDDVAGSTKYQDWIGMPTTDASGVSLGAISDIAAGSTNVWIVSGRAYAGGGSTIHSIPISQALSGSATWSNHVSGGQGARRIAMGQANVPWIINASGQVMCGLWLASISA